MILDFKIGIKKTLSKFETLTKLKPNVLPQIKRLTQIKKSF